jgi:hypothetical protein
MLRLSFPSLLLLIVRAACAASTIAAAAAIQFLISLRLLLSELWYCKLAHLTAVKNCHCTSSSLTKPYP